jgi:hypothetical protein
MIQMTLDASHMDWLVPISAVVGIWAFLGVLGSERDRRARELDYRIARATALAAIAADAAAAESANSPRPNR